MVKTSCLPSHRLLLKPSPPKGTYWAGGLGELQHVIKQLLDGKCFGNFRLHLLLNLILSSDAHYAQDGISCGLHSAHQQEASQLLLASLLAHECHNEGTQQAAGCPWARRPGLDTLAPTDPASPTNAPGVEVGGNIRLQPLYIHSQLWPQFTLIATHPHLSPWLGPASSNRQSLYRRTLYSSAPSLNGSPQPLDLVRTSC